MNAGEKISIIVPVKDAGQYLEECLDSIIGQTYKNIEILLIYTTSKDNSYEICQRYAKSDERVVLLKNDTGKVGPGVSRNIGLDNVTGEFIGFVDADDVIAQNMYETLYRNLIEYNADISICKETRDRYDLTKDQNVNKTTQLNKINALAEFLVGNKYYGELWNKLYRIKCIRDERFLMIDTGEDILYTWKVLQNAKTVIFTNQKCYYYRYNPNGISKQFNLPGKRENEKLLRETMNKDVEEIYPELKKQMMNRLAIMHVQDYIGAKTSKECSTSVEKELLQNARRYKFQKDNLYEYNKREKALVKLFSISPSITATMYKMYSVLKGRS